MLRDLKRNHKYMVRGVEDVGLALINCKQQEVYMVQVNPKVYSVPQFNEDFCGIFPFLFFL